MSYSRLKQTFNEHRGHSSAVASVLFSRGNDAHVQITRSGSYIYDGKASDYHEWEFRTRLRMKAAGTDERFYAEAMSEVIDGLRGQPFIIAKETGLENLWETGEGDLQLYLPDVMCLSKPSRGASSHRRLTRRRSCSDSTARRRAVRPGRMAKACNNTSQGEKDVGSC